MHAQQRKNCLFARGTGLRSITQTPFSINCKQEYQILSLCSQCPSNQIWSSVASAAVHWYSGDNRAWLSKIDGYWRGWDDEGREHVVESFEPWSLTRHADDRAPNIVRWFVGGKTNAGFNELDRVILDRGDGIAFIDDESDQLWYRSILLRDTLRVLENMTAIGLSTQDIVAIQCNGYASAVVAQACKRKGIPYTTIATDASESVVMYRLSTTSAKFLVTCTDISQVSGVTQVHPKDIMRERDHHNAYDMENVDVRSTLCSTWLRGDAPRPVDASHPNFILFTSGSTGKPKGIVHVHGGYQVGLCLTSDVVLHLCQTDVLFVAATPAWITGQSYMISSALLRACPSVLFEGSMLSPPSRFAQIIQRHGVSVFKAGSTFLRVVMSYDRYKCSLSDKLQSLRLAVSCAEPISETVHAFAKLYIVSNYINCYWATEHGGIIFGKCFRDQANDHAHTWPLPWIQADVDSDGDVLIKQRFPYMALTIWSSDGYGSGEWKGDADRWNAYFTKSGHYRQGDSVQKHTDGSFTFCGRSDEVMNIGGVRIGTGEVEDAIMAESIRDTSPVLNGVVIGMPDETLGTIPVAFIVCKDESILSCSEQGKLISSVKDACQPCLGCMKCVQVPEIPESISGKYMRRILASILQKQDIGDTSSLKNPHVVKIIQKLVHGVHDGVHDEVHDGVYGGVHDGLYGGVHDGVHGGVHDGVHDGAQIKCNALVQSIKDEIPSLVDITNDDIVSSCADSFDLMRLSQLIEDRGVKDMDVFEIANMTWRDLTHALSSETPAEAQVSAAMRNSNPRLTDTRLMHVVQFPGLDGSTTKFAVLSPWWSAHGISEETIDILSFTTGDDRITSVADKIANYIKARHSSDICLVGYSNGCFLAHEVACKLIKLTNALTESLTKPLEHVGGIKLIFIDPLEASKVAFSKSYASEIEASMIRILARAVTDENFGDCDENELRVMRDRIVQAVPSLQRRFDSMYRWLDMLAHGTVLGTAGLLHGVLMVCSSKCIFGCDIEERTASWSDALGDNRPIVSSIANVNHFDIISDPCLGLQCVLFILSGALSDSLSTSFHRARKAKVAVDNSINAFKTILWSQASFWTRLAGVSHNPIALTGAASATLAVYVLDRLGDSVEDKHNAHEDLSSFGKHGKDVAIISCAITLIASLYEDMIWKCAMLSIPLTYLYSYGVQLRNVRLKTAFVGAKTLYVSTVFLFWFFGTNGAFPPTSWKSTYIMWIYWQVQIVSNIIGDMKDIPGDKLAHVKTFPVHVGYGASKTLLLTLCGIISLQSCMVMNGTDATCVTISFVMLCTLIALNDMTRSHICGLCILSLQMLPNVIRYLLTLSELK